jgi:N-acetylmuramoyl-L-alanine amidase
MKNFFTKPLLFVLPLTLLLSFIAPYLFFGSFDPKVHAQTPLKIFVDGKIIPTSVPPVILDGRTLVPARSLFEYIGAKVEWDPVHKLVLISTQEKQIELAIGLSRAKINKKSVPLEVPPQILNDSTMIPLRFVAEALDMEVGFFPKDSLITIDSKNTRALSFFKGLKIEALENQIEIQIQMEGALNYKKMHLPPDNQSPHRLVIDLLHTKTPENLTRIDVYQYPVLSVRYTQLDTVSAQNANLPDKTVRVVVDLAKDSNYLLNTVGNNTLRIQIPAEKAPQDFKTLETNRGQTQRDPYFKEAVPETLENVNPTEAGTLNGVFLLEKEYGLLYAKSNPITQGILKYHALGDRVAIILENTALTSDRKDLKKHYTLKMDESKKVVTLTFPSKLSALEPLFMDISDAHLLNISVTKEKESTSLVFTAKEEFLYHVFSRPNLKDTAITLLKPPSKEAKLVVIDPGHGGSDSGAIHGGILEKDLNLDISLRLKQILNERNIQSYLLHYDDAYFDLYERAYIANTLSASLFLSIHNNAYVSNARGIETLYYGPTKLSNAFTGKDFAKWIQTHLVEKLGTPNRGIVDRPNLVVLRETAMPAALAEIGFMTNPQDAALLKDPAFRQKAAIALADAIEFSLSKF